MAERPEPLSEVLPQAKLVVVAEVVEALGGETPAQTRRLPIGAAPKLPEQQVRLKVERTLLGPEQAEIAVVKPAAGYVLAAGVKGPFLIDGSQPVPKILGRYGPDTYSLAVLEKALKR
ncbi:MAG TPA: hypothetical protein VGK67_32525 [Myxococcales bacterium]|jgi:hypothetical protein